MRFPAKKTTPRLLAYAAGFWTVLAVACETPSNVRKNGPLNEIGLKLIDVPAGEFQMGRSEGQYKRELCFYESPAHPVRITQAFRISATEVTVEQFRNPQTSPGATPTARKEDSPAPAPLPDAPRKR